MRSQCNGNWTIPTQEDRDRAILCLVDTPLTHWADLDTDLMATVIGSYEYSTPMCVDDLSRAREKMARYNASQPPLRETTQMWRGGQSIMPTPPRSVAATS